MKIKKEYGYTLVELLAVVVILSLIIGFVVYIAVNLINNSKNKSYQVTINNIEKNSGSYLLENSDRLFFVYSDDSSGDLEYQCITIRDLIDSGAFKNDVLESKVNDDKYVELDDYVYIERDINTKNIVKTKYLLNDENTLLCDSAATARGDVLITYAPISWSDDKEITIRYTVKNYSNIDNYKYHYDFSDGDVDIISDDGNVKKIRVNKNGTVTGYIMDNNGLEIVRNEKIINNIDKVAPVININSDLIKVYGSSFDLYEGVTITDNSGMDVSKSVSLNGVLINKYDSLQLGENVVTYKAVDKFGNESSLERKITIVLPDKEFNYMEDDQIYEVMADGVYVIEAYGAQGGNSGGLGGYVKAKVELKTGDKLVINTGGVNGYNGGGGYGNSQYYPGGGASTVRYNDSYIVIAGGGGAKGSQGSGGAGGSGNGAGAVSVGSGAGVSGLNGGGGSNSSDYEYGCDCKTYGGGCAQYQYEDCNCREVETPCHPSVARPSIQCYKIECQKCPVGCINWNPLWEYCSSTCTDKGNSGSGGKSDVITPAILIEKINGNKKENGYVKISYKLS